jgi:hypothetical protein
MRKIFLILALLVLSLDMLFSQIVISGSVRYAGNHAAVDMANVMVEDPGTNTVIGYATTGLDGQFNISCKTKSSTLTITVAGFNITRTSQTVKAHSQNVNIVVEYREMRLKEIVVKTKPIKRTGDTLTYYVSQFADSLDHSIGDVLKKMPGISVDKSGGVKYQGKAISKFYIEGLDMMGSRYGVATNNVRAKDIATVEIYENHQPVKMLKDLDIPERAALNLKLKDKSKGVLIATMQLGGGYKMWDEALTAMLFTSSYQMLVTAKSNNSGNDIVSELSEQYGESAQLSPYIGVYAPATPDVDIERYMDNTTHAVSVNNLFKLSKYNTLSVNGLYCYDRQSFKDSSMTIYYIPSTDPLKISESTILTRKTNDAEIRLKYTGNNDTYLEEALTIEAEWNDTRGSVLSQGDVINQRFDMMPNLSFKNDFTIVRNIKNHFTLSFHSNTSASRLPSTLTMAPAIYPSIFGYDQTEDSEAIQSVTNRAFHTNNYLNSIIKITPGLDLIVDVGVSADYQKMKSNLGMKSSVQQQDSLCNDIDFNRWNINSNMFLIYKYRILKLVASVNMDYAFINVADVIRHTNSSQSRPFFSPILDMDLSLTPKLKMNIKSSYFENYGSITDKYSGYIMTDYRRISSRDGVIGENRRQDHNVEFKYSNALSAFFASAEAGYWRKKSNLMYGTSFNGVLSRIESYNLDNISKGFRANGRVSKFVDVMASTFELNGGFEKFWMDVLRQGNVINTNTAQISGGVKLITKWSRKVRSQYNTRYVYSKTIYSDNSLAVSSINSLHQKLSIDYSLIPGLVFNLTGEHYFNSAIISGSRHIPFLDASLTFKTKKTEYVLEGRNLLDTRTYNNRFTSEATDFEYSYRLRPISAMFKIKFNIN